ncbi:MAG: carbamoyltransferase HypF [Chlorobi bacterium]|nr:carbamoyltransferase HypF [Chlorobiota bacterium]
MPGYTIHIKGLVQGVGFRPYVYRIALQHKIYGTVENRNDGVWIHVITGREVMESFVRDLRLQVPPAAEISTVEVLEASGLPEYDKFTILGSRDLSDEITLISPDIAVCDDCLRDMKEQSHRIGYPFINCTNCGPRFTIIEDLPYDRLRTTMKEFRMCSVCRKEYDDVNDRRFHAQPVACHTCGPHYTLHLDGKEIIPLNQILRITGGMLQQGQLLAVKGMGGYFLACDALNEPAVARLRRAKLREDKPFAVMFRDLETLRHFTRVSAAEEKTITSWRRPIVLLESVQALAPSVCMGFGTIGAMLPYMPFHYLLFRDTELKALVLTSGNLSNEPIVINDREALNILGPVTDGVLTYNRRIHNRVDDSVLHVVGEKQRLIRRSRGFAPAPIETLFPVDGILATGAELVSTFCLGKSNMAFLSQHIGDLKNYETYAFYTESLDRFKELFRVSPEVVVCDMHPDYLSTRYAMETGLPVIQVQHHHAHIAACMAEYKLDEPVIGVSFDGTGYGTDGNIWGGEFLVCDLQKFERRSHLGYVPMPGGDLAALQPWRMAVSYLWYAFGEEMEKLNLPFLEWVRAGEKVHLLMKMIRKKINTPYTSSAGRLFDAVAALTGICRESTFHAEAPMRLEAAIVPHTEGMYSWLVQDEIIDLRPAIREIVKDIIAKTAPGAIAARFHRTIAHLIVEKSNHIRKETGLNKIILSGGTFQNRYLLGITEEMLEKLKFEVFISEKVPVNDGGISLGQLTVAGALRNSRD